MNRQARRAALYRKPAAATQTGLTLEQITRWAELIESVRPFEPGEKTDKFVEVRSGFERLRTGVGDTDDFELVSKSLYLAMLRAEQINASLATHLLPAMAAFACAKAGYQSTLTIGFDDQGIQDIAEAIDAYEVIVQASSPMQMRLAIKEMCARIRAGNFITEELKWPNTLQTQ